ncbi:leucine-rich repeat-containing protein 43-like isoform X2 [Hydractinia symbiolongicarpus]|uniref:leucine-rich repeat-containing protein 43-like isoform X2 n=1 Tax=Hydractinia symbiolongicarpus TaxID=13093 RepID=UPI00254E72E1|nr:leucine-rich repeat-containing protein 43-like isoform X2 [Hydractinia symbiolongicarpus]
MQDGTKSVSDVFNGLLKQLALDEFPSGNGNWKNHLKWRSDLLEPHNSTKNADLFSVESLKYLANEIPFQKDTDWSVDAAILQDKMIENGEAMALQSIHRCFKRLRIIDKHVATVDQGLKKFTNLTELILTANNIETVDSSLLPRSLKILELCGNRIGDVKSLCSQPPKLQHLGLSYNQLRCFSNFTQRDCWFSLLSLDLSFNYLSDVKSTVDALKKLPKLKSLVLKGNPLYFFIGHRGYVIDSIKSLTFLDEVRISEDERHHFKGLTNLKDLCLDDMCITVKIDGLKGLSRPDEMENSGDDFPKYFTKYRVELDFISGCEVQDQNVLTQEKTEQDIVVTSEDDSLECVTKDAGDASGKDVSKIQTTEEVWCEEEGVSSLTCNKVIVSRNTTMFNEYIKRNIKLNLIESRILISNEQKPCNIDEIEKLCNDPSGISKEKSNKSAGRRPSRASAMKGKDGKSEKPKKKINKQDATQLFEWSRTTRVIASCEVNTQMFLQGQVIDEDFLMNVTPPPSVPVCTDSYVKKTESKKKSGKDARRGSVRSVASLKPPKIKPIKTIHEISDVNTEQGEQTPLTVHFYMELIQWKSTQDGAAWSQKCPSGFS